MDVYQMSASAVILLYYFIVNDKGLKPLTCQNKNNTVVKLS